MEEEDETNDNVTDVEFLVPQNYQGVCDLFKYIVVNLQYQTEVCLQNESVVSFGKRHLPQPESLEDVVVNTSVRKIGGAISRAHELRSSQFSVKRDFQNDSEVYTGIRFEVTPGYEPGQLSSDDLDIMKDVKEVVQGYFAEVKRGLSQRRSS